MGCDRYVNKNTTLPRGQWTGSLQTEIQRDRPLTSEENPQPAISKL